MATPQTVTLNGRELTIQLEGYEFGPQDTFRDGVIANDQPSDSMFNARGAWTRYRVSWHHGADQEIGDMLDEADAYRFDESYGFDPWSKLELKMLPGVIQAGDVTIAGNPILQRSSNYLYLADGVVMSRLDASSLVPTSMSDMPGFIYSLCSDGKTLYAAGSTGVIRWHDTDLTKTVFTNPVTTPSDKIAFVGGRLLVGQLGVLAEIASSGTAATITTHFQTDWRWTVIFAIGSRIYAGGFAGPRSELYTFTTDSGGALVKGTEAMTFPFGEQLLCAASVAGAVLLGTSAGVRLAQLTADGTLTYGPLIDKIGACRSIATDGNFAWVTWNDTTTHLDGSAGLARLDLSAFVNTLQPAYAADVHVHGLEEVYTVERFSAAGSSPGETVRQVVFAGLDGFLYRAFDEDESYYGPWNASSAKITSGLLLLGSVEPKAAVEVEVRFAPLPDTATVTVTVVDENDVVLGTGSASTDGQEILTVTLDGSLIRAVRVTIEATQSVSRQVHIYSWRLRSYPAPPQVLQWIVPVNTHQNVIDGDGQGRKRSQDSAELITFIAGLHATKEQVEYIGPEGTYQVRVENFKHVPTRWTNDGVALQGVCQVQLVAL